MIDLHHFFVDGTKIEANANKYSFVLGKAVQNYAQKLREKIQVLLEEVQVLTKEEINEFGVETQLEKVADTLEKEIVQLTESIENEEDKEHKTLLRQERSAKKNKSNQSNF